MGDPSEEPEGTPGQRPARPGLKGSVGPRTRYWRRPAGSQCQEPGAGRFLASHPRTRPFLSLTGPAPPPGSARWPGAARVDGSRGMLMRGRAPQPIGCPRSVGEVSAESQKNRAGPAAACSASGADARSPPARRPAR